jgi:NAD(P)-dependent dehydrogenase (short-subunit alcohol dehydrogenase family)
MTGSDPQPRTALVTGAARGIGRMTAEALAAAGWRVVAGVRDPGALAPLGGPRCHVVRLDVTDADSIRSGVAEAERVAGGALRCVVNNAGWALFGAIEDVDLGEARREFETNLFGAVAVLQAALPRMREAGAGVVVSVSTLSGRVPLPLFGMYSASKLALAAVTDALALELGPSGIRTLLIEAGVVRTEFARSTVVSGSVAETQSAYAPVGERVLDTLRGIRDAGGIAPDEVASAIVRGVEDPATPARVVLADEGLRGVADAIGGPAADAYTQVRALLGLEAPGGAGGST